MGSKSILGAGNSITSVKTKPGSDSVDDAAAKDYFFAKYLTSPELLDLEVNLPQICDYIES